MVNVFDPHGKNIVVFDLEIKESIDGEKIKWTSYKEMGISVGCLYDYATGDNMVYMDDNMDLLANRIALADLVVGFHILGFDIPLLAAHADTPGELVNGMHAPSQFDAFVSNPLATTYDLLKESRKAVNKGPFPKGLKLDDHLKGTFGLSFVKTADGAEAPLMYKRGEIGKLVSYCLADVRRERALFEHVCLGRPVVTATHGEKFLREPKL